MLKYRTLPVTAFQQNCSLLWCDDSFHGVLIDPGGDTDRLIALVEVEGVTLQAIWLTHGHLDHVGAAAALRKHFSIPIIGPHADDRFLFDAIPMQCEMFGFDAIDSFLPDQYLSDGEQLKLDDETFNVIHTPGHTPGHVVIAHETSAIVWVGDVLFKGSIGRTDFPRGNHQALLTSIKQKLLSLGDDYRFVPGHGPESTLGYERLNNPFLV